jgi:hypothetical protein
MRLDTEKAWRSYRSTRSFIPVDLRDRARVAIWNAAQPPLSDATGLAANALDAEAVRLVRECVRVARSLDCRCYAARLANPETAVHALYCPRWKRDDFHPAVIERS